MPYPVASAIEIDRKLREDFRRRLEEYGVKANVTDPVLAVLFRTFAQQLENLYSETERIRLGLLDELIAGLGLEQRMARPAQSVVRFYGAAGCTAIEAGSDLCGTASTGAKLNFKTDAALTVSDARICCGMTYQDGVARLIPGVDMPEKFQAARPSLEPVKTNLGPNPALYLAVDPPSRGTLSGHAFYFDLGPDARPIQSALERETWCLASAAGDFAGPGILRPRRSNAGVRRLEWLIPDRSPAAAPVPRNDLPLLQPGFYAGRIYTLPVIPSTRVLACRVPRGLDAVLGRLFEREAASLFAADRVWIRIGFPESTPALHTGLSGVFLHAMTVSNIECLNQTIYFERHGTSIPAGYEGGAPWRLVAPLSVTGESDTPYLLPTEPSTDSRAGRFAIRNGRVEFTPARRAGGNPESCANLRLWISSGEEANLVGPGAISAIEVKDGPSGIRVMNPTSAAGAADAENATEAQARFAGALLSRDRVVTRADLYAAARAFDRRILEASIHSGVDRHQGALRRVERVSVHLRRSDFHDPDLEVRYLSEDLTEMLAARFVHDVAVVVEPVWEEAR